ncbi:MAG TPA: DUF1080 domain-containing protein [Bacteroidales bacterium]|nr:DUF1080 domain-containing protein [Bacteroidales bacterium]
MKHLVTFLLFALWCMLINAQNEKPKVQMPFNYAEQEAIVKKFMQKFDSLTPMQQNIFFTNVKHIMEPEVKKIEAGQVDDAPPSDAIVLFDGKNLDEWEEITWGMGGPGGKKPISWVIKDGGMQPQASSGTAQTKRTFRDFQLHIEWKTPVGLPATVTGQDRGNSGVIIQGNYEVQILDSYSNRTYRNGQAGAVYMQYAPLVNPASKEGEWQSYDIIYTAPRFKDDHTYFTPPRITVLYNGVLIQNNVEIQGPTVFPGIPQYIIKEHGDGPIQLQQHGNPTTFRNIWIREL